MLCVRLLGWVFDESARALRDGSEIVHVSPRAFDLLGLLIGRHPDAVSKAEILEVLRPDTFVAGSNPREEPPVSATRRPPSRGRASRCWSGSGTGAGGASWSRSTSTSPRRDTSGDFELGRTLRTVEGEGGLDPVERVPPQGRYDDNHRGVSQALGHGVVPARLAGSAACEILHCNDLLDVRPGHAGERASNGAYVIARFHLAGR